MPDRPPAEKREPSLDAAVEAGLGVLTGKALFLKPHEAALAVLLESGELVPRQEQEGTHIPHAKGGFHLETPDA